MRTHKHLRTRHEERDEERKPFSSKSNMGEPQIFQIPIIEPWFVVLMVLMKRKMKRLWCWWWRVQLCLGWWFDGHKHRSGKMLWCSEEWRNIKITSLPLFSFILILKMPFFYIVHTRASKGSCLLAFSILKIFNSSFISSRYSFIFGWICTWPIVTFVRFIKNSKNDQYEHSNQVSTKCIYLWYFDNAWTYLIWESPNYFNSLFFTVTNIN